MVKVLIHTFSLDSSEVWQRFSFILLLWTAQKYGKGSHSSFFGQPRGCRRHMQSVKTHESSLVAQVLLQILLCVGSYHTMKLFSCCSLLIYFLKQTVYLLQLTCLLLMVFSLQNWEPASNSLQPASNTVNVNIHCFKLLTANLLFSILLLHPFQHSLSHIETMGGRYWKALCNEVPYSETCVREPSLRQTLNSEG